uniref:Uncharacterized protein n=1 Tax=Zea mays TaxID=4577 RepID=B7ZX08_MAIZE|nr:unknown [Zea mays]ACN33371.1 unknown [Zea mays]|eukprot:XP_008665557.1 uncharacterized protein LOC100279226 [Zea mays]
MIHPHKAQTSARNGCASEGDASLDRDGAAKTFAPLKRWPDTDVTCHYPRRRYNKSNYWGLAVSLLVFVGSHGAMRLLPIGVACAAGGR